MEFGYQSATLIDRAPDPTVASHAQATFADVRARMVISDRGVWPTYPSAPPSWFHDSELVKQLRLRWRAVREDRAPLLAEAYFCLTRIEQALGGGRLREAAARLNVDFAVLQKAMQIASINDPEVGRKAKGQKRRLTDDEALWLYAVINQLIFRVAQIEGSVSDLKRLTLGDFPRLP